MENRERRWLGFTQSVAPLRVVFATAVHPSGSHSGLVSGDISGIHWRILKLAGRLLPDFVSRVTPFPPFSSSLNLPLHNLLALLRPNSGNSGSWRFAHEGIAGARMPGGSDRTVQVFLFLFWVFFSLDARACLD